MGSGGTEGAVIRWPSARHHRPRAMKRCGSCWNSLTRAISIALPMRCRPRKRAAMRNSPIIGISVCGAMDAGAAQGRHAAHRNPLYGGVQNASRVCRPRAHRRFRRQPDAASEGLRSIPAIREQCHGILGRDNPALSESRSTRFTEARRAELLLAFWEACFAGRATKEIPGPLPPAEPRPSGRRRRSFPRPWVAWRSGAGTMSRRLFLQSTTPSFIGREELLLSSGNGASVTNRRAPRIASPEMLLESDPLSHVTCSRAACLWSGDGADRHGNTA
jgi:hypothetical protein